MALNYWFPVADGCNICPRWILSVSGSDPRQTVNRVIYVIEHLHRGWPLLLLDLEPSTDFHRDLGREKAISRVMQHLDEI